MTATLDQETQARDERLAAYNRRLRSPSLPLTAEQRDLVADNHRLVYWFVAHRCGWVRERDREELTSALFEVLIRAAQTYDGRTRFATWAYQWFRAGISKWQVARERLSRQQLLGDGDETLPQCDSPPKQAADAEEVARCRGYCDEQGWLVLELSVIDGLSNPAIGRRLGLSGERVRQILDRALRQIRRRAAAHKMAQGVMFP